MAVATMQKSVQADINFIAWKMDSYVVSNYVPEWTTLETAPHRVEVHNARLLDPPASYHREGFELHRMAVENPRWEDDDWIMAHYLPRLKELALEITGGAEAVTFPGSWVIRDTGRKGAATAAAFAHMDRERENCREIIRSMVDEAIWSKYPRFEMVNFWRSLTPPPQDVPLAICDQRTTFREDWVIGETREPEMHFKVRHMASVYNPENRWYYYPDMTADELIVFRNYEDDENRQHGCLHGAFTDSTVTQAVPRASLETRIYVFHES